jgi:hypothetical protein
VAACDECLAGSFSPSLAAPLASSDLPPLSEHGCEGAVVGAVCGGM